MDERADALERVGELLRGQRFAALATNAAQAPYLNLVAFAVSEDLRSVVFSTMRATRKFSNLRNDPHVAMLFDDRTNEETDLQQAVAATAVGAGEVVEGEERERCASLLLTRHPHLASFVSSPDCAIIRVDVDTYHAVVRFQDVYEIRLSGPSGVASGHQG